VIAGIAALVAALISGIGLYLSKKKNKEDVSLATLAAAITTWRDIAESHKGHWDQCEDKCDVLEKEVEELRRTVFILDLKVKGIISVDSLLPIERRENKS
jgi:hypothetical protein